MPTPSPSSPPSSYVIIGAGVFGTSTALHLIRAYPNASITLIDRDPFDEDFIPAPIPSPSTKPASSTSLPSKPRGARVAASWDWNKVVRADYADRLYCRLALEAQEKWRHDKLWKEWYQETGIFWISRTGIAERVVENFEALGAGKGAGVGGDVLLPETMNVDQAKGLYGGIFDEADYTGVEKVLINRTSGWADAKGALRAATMEAIRLGVEYVVAEVEELVFDSQHGNVGDDGLLCTGVRTSSGETITATHVILCTGAYTPRLLEQSAQQTFCEELRAGDRIIAAAVTTGIAQLDELEAERFRGMPVCCLENPPERGASNGTLPINADNQIKWWGQRILKNTIPLPPPRANKTTTSSPAVELSMPPPEPDYAEWSVPPALQEDVKFANKVTFGSKGKDWNIGQFRICWLVPRWFSLLLYYGLIDSFLLALAEEKEKVSRFYAYFLDNVVALRVQVTDHDNNISFRTREALTPSHDFIISPHSAARGLYIATCGSFHGWKFFPIIGDYIVQMLEGRLDTALAEKWAWNREVRRVPNDREWPHIELRDLWQEKISMGTPVGA